MFTLNVPDAAFEPLAVAIDVLPCFNVAFEYPVFAVDFAKIGVPASATIELVKLLFVFDVFSVVLSICVNNVLPVP